MENSQCFVCNKSFETVELCEMHNRLHAEQNPLVCHLCSSSFCSVRNLRKHSLLHEKGKPYICILCDQAVPSLRDLKSHVLFHTGECPFKCNECHRSYKRRHYLNLHQQIHSKENPFRCVLCDKSMRSAYDLKSHIRVHSGENNFICNVCCKTFSRLCDLNRHELSVHSESTSFQSSICKKAVQKKDDLVRHNLMSSETQPSKFNVGFRSYFDATKSKWNSILLTYKKIPYKCGVCKKSFTTAQILRRHRKTMHINEKPYKSAVSGKKSFTLRHSKNDHSYSRANPTTKESYKCNVCLNSFLRLDHLKMHERIHEPVRVKLNCDLCSRSYMSNRTLKDHMNRHHPGGKILKCTTCSKSFLTRQEFRAHDKVHNDDYFPSKFNVFIKDDLLQVEQIEKPLIEIGDDSSIEMGRESSIEIGEESLQDIVGAISENRQQLIQSSAFQCFVCRNFFESLELLGKHCCIVEVESSKERVEECSKEIDEDSSKETGEKSSVETGEDSLKEIDEDSSKETGEKSSVETGEDSLKEIDEDSSKETGEKSSVERGRDTSKDNIWMILSSLESSEQPIQSGTFKCFVCRNSFESLELLGKHCCTVEVGSSKEIGKDSSKEIEGESSKEIEGESSKEIEGESSKEIEGESSKENVCVILSSLENRKQRIQSGAFECFVCRNSFKSLQLLGKHYCSRNEVGLLKCYDCLITLPTHCSLVTQIHSHDNSNNTSFKCTECFALFAHERLLMRHLYSHLGI